MSVFKAEKLTWHGKLKACLDSEIKYCIQTMLYIWWEEQRLVSKCLRQIPCRLKISGSVFLSKILFPIMIPIFVKFYMKLGCRKLYPTERASP